MSTLSISVSAQLGIFNLGIIQQRADDKESWYDITEFSFSRQDTLNRISLSSRTDPSLHRVSNINSTAINSSGIIFRLFKIFFFLIYPSFDFVQLQKREKYSTDWGGFKGVPKFYKIWRLLYKYHKWKPNFTLPFVGFLRIYTKYPSHMINHFRGKLKAFPQCFCAFYARCTFEKLLPSKAQKNETYRIFWSKIFFFSIFFYGDRKKRGDKKKLKSGQK